MKKIAKALKALGITSQEEMEDYIQNELNYMVEEGLAVQLPNGNYRLKTSEENQKELDVISITCINIFH
jgi:hypothetical protein